jgi:hypothetical protein
MNNLSHPGATLVNKPANQWAYKGQTITLLGQNLGKYIRVTAFIEGSRNFSEVRPGFQKALSAACEAIDERMAA